MRAFLCGEGKEHRKEWIEDHLRELAGILASNVCGFAIMDNHLHVLLRLDPVRGRDWSDLQIAEK